MELLASPPSESSSRLPIGARFRLRPGEQPIWLDATQWQAKWAGWRREADETGLPLDALLSLAIELRLVATTLALTPTDTAGLLNAPVPAAAIAPEPELRHWLAQLEEGSGVGEDELPEIVLPRRLVQTGRWSGALDALVDEDFAMAIAAEAAAAREGRTIEGLTLSRLASLASAE